MNANVSNFAPGRSVRGLVALVTAMAGGTLMHLLGWPLPWLLGPMIGVLSGSSIWRGKYHWPSPVRNAGMIAVGYTIGLSLTGAALREMGAQLPTMLLMTAMLLLLCATLAAVVAKLGGIPYLTALMGSIPGGLTQVLILAEETKGVNLTVVTIIQVVRLMMIVICIPLLIFSPIFGFQVGDAVSAVATSGEHNDWAGLWPALPIYAVVCTLFALLGDKVRFPTAFLLAPALGAALLQAAGLHGPALPAPIIDAAQLAIGTYVGLLLKPAQLERKLRILSLAALSGIGLLACAIGLSFLLTKIHPLSLPTALLSLAPGGMDQMGLVAHEIGADLSTVAGYQLFRTFFIFFAIPPLLRWIIRLATRRAADEEPGKETS
ncbi:AbrB family transcriptional regulator [Cohnella ginsengisoli]|uniref:AbrB family transcriptional regulator n=1 Tax=Cohnella ginsengisoli TaxID=425004 RepID=A0A9X4QNH1_9BACL|nr:AbrB family transcriptional regulator [Cohnella ginsengisoli]MDG0792783.1 AbrB family transcriptional regulator [Cohnella ginsengisoli]